MTPLTAEQALDRHFLEARSKLLDLAAILDRINRGQRSSDLDQDLRIQQIRQALNLLLETGESRAERIQKVFSLEYDESWPRPQPR